MDLGAWSHPSLCSLWSWLVSWREAFCRKRYRAWVEEQRGDAPALPAREGDLPEADSVPQPIGIDDGLPEVSVEAPDDLVEVDVGDLGLGVPSKEDYLPESERVDPPSEPSPQLVVEDVAEDDGYGVGMDVDACLFEPSFEPLDAASPDLSEDFLDQAQFKVSVSSPSRKVGPS